MRKTVFLGLAALLAVSLVGPEAAFAGRRDKKKESKTFNVEELCDRQYASGLEFKKNSRLVDAKDAFVSVIEACPSYRKAFIQLGNIALQLRDYPAAIEHYEKALELDDTDLDAKEALGFAYQSSGRMDDAVDLFAGILEAEPARLSSIQYLAVAYEQQEKKPEAFMLYAQAFTADSTIAGLEEKLANLALELKQWESAYTFTRRQVDRAPDNIDLKRKLAFFHYRAEDWDEAVNKYNELIVEYPDDSGTLSDRKLVAYCLNKAGRIEEAFPVYDYILDNDPSPEENTFYLFASALVDAKRFSKAIEVANKGLAINSGWGCVAYVKAEAMSKRGEALQGDKDWEGARTAFKQAKAAFASVPQSRCSDNASRQMERQDQLLDRLGKLQAKAETGE